MKCFSIVLLWLVFLCAGSLPALANTWIGGGSSSNFSDGANWQEGSPPATGGDVTVSPPGSGYRSTTINVDTAGVVIGTLSASPYASVTVKGNPIRILQGATAATNAGITFAIDVQIAAGATVTAIDLGGIGFDSSHQMTAEGGEVVFQSTSVSGTIAVDSNISEVSPTTFRFEGRGRMYFSGAAHFTGGLIVNGSAAVSTRAVGTGPIRVGPTGGLGLGWSESALGPIANAIDLEGTLVFNIPFITLSGPLHSDTGTVQPQYSGTLAGPFSGAGLTIFNAQAPPLIFASPSSTPGALVLNHSNVAIPVGSSPSVQMSLGSLLVLNEGAYSLPSVRCDSSSSVRISLGTTQLSLHDGFGCMFDLRVPPGTAIPPSGEIVLVQNTGSAPFAPNASAPEGTSFNINGSNMLLTYQGGTSHRDITLQLPPNVPHYPTQITASTRTIFGLGAGLSTGGNELRLVVSANGAPFANAQVTYTVIGGCGSVNGAMSASATSGTDGSVVPPNFTAGGAYGTCIVRASVPTASGSISQDFAIQVYDFSTAHLVVTPAYALVAPNQQLSVTVQFLDGGGRTIPNEPLGAQNFGCPGMIPSPASANTDSNGIASFVFTMGPTQGSMGTCTIGIQTASSFFDARLPISIYLPGHVTFDVSNPTITVTAGQQFNLTLRPYSGGLGTPYLPITAVVRAGTGGATCTLANTNALSDFAANATFTCVANSLAGTYSIVFSVPGQPGVLTYQVTQVLPTPNPPTPPTPPTSPTPPSQAIPGIAYTVQDMWWAGSAENGWGMSLIQHSDTLVGAIYIYDANGKPTWLFMPGGAWDSTHAVYSGSLYTPSGTPFFAYDTSHWVAGDAKGTVTITFQDTNDAILDYKIGGITGRKLITRETFASGAATTPDRSDLWWGGTAQNGWGITVIQQASTLFPLWFTYDANGIATWYSMPGGTWTASDTYEGRIYRTTGSAWVGAQYDATKLQVFDVGPYKIQFTGDNASFTYTIDGHTGTIPLVREPF